MDQLKDKTGKMMNERDIIKINRENYRAIIDIVVGKITVVSKTGEKVLIDCFIDSAVDTLKETDKCLKIEMHHFHEVDLYSKVAFSIKSSVWQEKFVEYEFFEDYISTHIELIGNGQRIKNLNYLLNRSEEKNYTDYKKIYAPRFDWFIGEVEVDANKNDSLSCQQWLSPPPFSYAFLAEDEAVYAGVAAHMGEYNFLSFDYNGEKGPYFSLAYEGHTVVNDYFVSPKLVIGFGGKDPNKAIEAYVGFLRENNYLPKEEKKDIPLWWNEPIFCSWGQMRYDYREDHDGHENGFFINVTNYATEKIHTNYIDILDEKGINPGTIIIDMGWAENPALAKPSEKKWFDLRAFIEKEHEKGRKVLLWYTPVVTKGLPIEACMTLSGKPVAPDPTSPVYKDILAKEIYKMISSDDGCLNADGFKIDFTQCTPSEDGRFTSYLESFWALINDDNEKFMYDKLDKRDELIKTHGDKWGVEILRAYIELIYINMKSAKRDSVLITHTANPYFADIVDVLRLNDLDGECDNVLAVMENRAKIAKMCCKNWLLDTDNDLMIDKKRWRDYIKLQPKLGIPDTYYVKSIAMSGELFDESDYELIRNVWGEYRNKLAENVI